MDMAPLTASKPDVHINQPATRRKLPVAIGLAALAFGAVAVATIAFGRLLSGNTTVKKLHIHIGELRVDHLEIKN
jgi:hypothetical protein